MKENYSIVLADDDPDDHFLFKQALNKINNDCTLVSVYDGSELLDYLLKKGKYSDSKAVNPDVIILDLNMPILTGLEALEKIKSHRDLNKIPVYILSTAKTFTKENKASELRADGYYQKPYTNKKLEQIIAEILISL